MSGLIFFAALAALLALGPRLFVVVGICGGFTTFSAFSLQTLALLQEGQPIKALANVLLSVLLCLAATWAGWCLTS